MPGLSLPNPGNHGASSSRLAKTKAGIGRNQLRPYHLFPQLTTIGDHFTTGEGLTIIIFLNNKLTALNSLQ
jgi:hypothetical protein